VECLHTGVDRGRLFSRQLKTLNVAYLTSLHHSPRFCQGDRTDGYIGRHISTTPTDSPYSAAVENSRRKACRAICPVSYSSLPVNIPHPNWTRLGESSEYLPYPRQLLQLEPRRLQTHHRSSRLRSAQRPSLLPARRRRGHFPDQPLLPLPCTANLMVSAAAEGAEVIWPNLELLHWTLRPQFANRR